MVRPLPPRRPVGFRRDGRPIYPILGASADDETNDQHDDGADTGPEQQVTVTQDRLGKMLTREKAQGERAAVKRLLAALGFESPKALTEFVTTQREAEQAALSEVERREQAAQELVDAVSAQWQMTWPADAWMTCSWCGRRDHSRGAIFSTTCAMGATGDRSRCPRSENRPVPGREAVRRGLPWQEPGTCPRSDRRSRTRSPSGRARARRRADRAGREPRAPGDTRGRGRVRRRFRSPSLRSSSRCTSRWLRSRNGRRASPGCCHAVS
ncbi:hypothetical protein EDD92_9428 [Streptomyces sp. TLI_185]|nr:hypothetical protein EDD92_9428 [Streptomyces sp. TLI_185]